MYLALGVLALWLGSAFLWVASHGLPGEPRGFGDIWSSILSGVAGQP